MIDTLNDVLKAMQNEAASRPAPLVGLVLSSAVELMLRKHAAESCSMVHVQVSISMFGGMPFVVDPALDDNTIQLFHNWEQFRRRMYVRRG